jgi:hypothetical protein
MTEHQAKEGLQALGLLETRHGAAWSRLACPPHRCISIYAAGHSPSDLQGAGEFADAAKTYVTYASIAVPLTLIVAGIINTDLIIFGIKLNYR